jgi:hypothetical protein
MEQTGQLVVNAPRLLARLNTHEVPPKKRKKRRKKDELYTTVERQFELVILESLDNPKW